MRYRLLSPWLFGTYFTPDEGGSGGGGTPPEEPPAAPAGDPPPTDPPAGDKEQKFDAAYVKQLRDEAAAHRAKLRDAEKKLKVLEDEKLTDTEKKDKRLKELETETAELRQKARTADVERAAVKAGAHDPEVVAKLVSADEEDLEKAIAALKKAKPYLFTRPGGGSADGGAGGSAAKPGMNDFIRASAGRR